MIECRVVEEIFKLWPESKEHSNTEGKEREQELNKSDTKLWQDIH